MLTIIEGRAGELPAALMDSAARALSRGGRVHVVVPKQLTLQTELELIRALAPSGSFEINVVSPERLCARVFSSAGRPSLTRVDDRGRVMLARAAIREAGDDLRVYSGAQHRRGFPARAARQIEIFLQAGLTSEDVFALADAQTGLLEAKTRDMAHILSAYERLSENRFQDGEVEFLAAAERCAESDVVDCAGIIFYGFDVMPMPLHALMGALAVRANVEAIFCCDMLGGDSLIFSCVEKSLARLAAAAQSRGADVKSVKIPPRPIRGDINFLERNLFSSDIEPREESPNRNCSTPPQSIRVAALPDINSEAAYVAGRARELARQGMRWRDMAIMCADMNSYAQPLSDAFADFDIPLFMTASRASSRHALSEALTSALRLISRSFRTEDALALLRSGFSGIEGREADILANYFTRYSPRGRQLTRPLTIGDDAREVEPLRERLIAPVLSLREKLRAARDIGGSLSALYEYLCSINAYETVLARSRELTSRALHSLAGEETQVWNRLISTMDQAASLMSGTRLSLRELEELLRDSLDAAPVKALPQSGDAVCAQSADTLLARGVKCVFFMGLTDRSRLGSDALISPRQLAALSAASGKYLGPDESDAASMRFYYIKCALGMTSGAAFFTYPMSLSDGSAQKPSALIGDVKRLLGLTEETVISSPEIARLLISAPRAAFRRGARSVLTMEKESERLARALDARRASEAMRPETARSIYGALEKASVTRLEAFARCPFSHFITYALAPERVEPFELTTRDEGSFFHEAVRAFVAENMEKLGALEPEAAESYMDGVCDSLLGDMESGALGASNIARAQKRRLKNAARAAARAIVRQMQGSDFRTVEVEMGFGDRDARSLTLSVNGEPCALEGRVDRIDEWEGAEADYLRVIDYKRGGTDLRLGAAYLGLQLQLMLYLAAAMKRRRALGAGVYYFRVDEGIISTQETDPAEIERGRMDGARLRGLTLDDADVLRAMSPAPDDVITVKINNDGTISKTSAATDVLGMRKLIDITLERAAEDVSQIREGSAETSPARTAKQDACKFCQNRRACLFDETADAARVRKMDEPTNAEILEKLRQTTLEQ